MPNYLSIDTSAHTSVALVDSTTGDVIAQRTSPKGNDQTETLSVYVRDLLAENHEDGRALAGIFVGVGPGPYTGLRAGLVAARTFGFVWNIPVYGVVSLPALAQPPQQLPDDLGGRAADADIDLVEHQGRNARGLRRDDLDRQADT